MCGLNSNNNNNNNNNLFIIIGWFIIQISCSTTTFVPLLISSVVAARPPAVALLDVVRHPSMQRRALFVPLRRQQYYFLPSYNYIPLQNVLDRNGNHLQHYCLMPVVQTTTSRRVPLTLLRDSSSTGNGINYYPMSTDTNNNNQQQQQQQQHVMMEELATRLVEGYNASEKKIIDRNTNNHPSSNNKEEERIHNMKVCIAVAGGGSSVASSIASRPGASSILLESIITYDRRSFAEYILKNIPISSTTATTTATTTNTTTTNIPPKWLLDLENSSLASESDNTPSPSQIINNSMQRESSSSTFQFCSIEAAVLLSRASLHRSIQLTPTFQDRCFHCVGVGCASALVGNNNIIVQLNKMENDGNNNNSSSSSSREERSSKNKNKTSTSSKAYIAISTVKVGTWIWELELDNGIPSSSNDDDGDSNVVTIDLQQQQRRRRSRSQEEAVVSNVILWAMTQYYYNREQQDADSYYYYRLQDEDNMINSDDSLRRILDRRGDKLSVKKMDSSPLDNDDDDARAARQSAAYEASQMIIDGKANAVAIVPYCHDLTASSNRREENCSLPIVGSRMETVLFDNNAIFPSDVLIVPGSFNPPHHGHIGLANAAVSLIRRLRIVRLEDDTVDDTTTDTVLSSSSSSSNDSSSHSSSSILSNLRRTVDRHTDRRYDPTVFFEMSVTNADKSPLNPNEVERRVDIFASLPHQDMPKDWAVMLTNAPLFSQKSKILTDLMHTNCPVVDDGLHCRRRICFVIGADTMVRIINPKYYGNNSREEMVAALIEMKKSGITFIVGGRVEPGSNKKFVNGEEELMSLPPEVRAMFMLLTESEFRLDISSTEIRERSTSRETEEHKELNN